MDLEKAINLDDLRKMAKRRIPKVVYDFIEGGVDDEDGLDRNEDAFRKRPLMPRYLVDVSKIDIETTLFGKTYAAPFGIAPTGGISNYRWGGDLMLAEAAQKANIPFIMSGAATASMEDLAKVAPEHGWYQLYAAKDKKISEDMIKRAADLGLSTLVITVDVPAGANRERNKRNGFGRPLKLSLASKLDALTKPQWMRDYLTHGVAMLPNWAPYTKSGATAEEVGEFVTSQVRATLTWKDIENFRKIWPRNLVIKGIMRVDDARRALDAGVDGLMVSNHGARQLDRAPSPLDVLPHIDAAVGDKMTLMLDGGIRRGSDILIAMAMGAKFIFLGRPTLYGVIAGGVPGATKAVRLLRSEMETVMAQMGCPSLDQLTPDFVLWDDDRRNAPG